jgi:formamidopyrimidine-DNA glycosylase
MPELPEAEIIRRGIKPFAVGKKKYALLADNIRRVLLKSIETGDTRFRDFFDSEGRPGYYTLHLHVCGKNGTPCPQCGRPVSAARVGRRSIFFCSNCQK